MKKFSFLFLFIIVFGSVYFVSAQDCTPDPNVTDMDEPGQISPDSLPVAMLNEYYDETVTIIPPNEYEGLNLIHSIVIDSICGLPDGINWYKNENEFLVTDPITRYCVNLYGTPTEQGEFPLTLYITPYINLTGDPFMGTQMVDDTSMSIKVVDPLKTPVFKTEANLRAYPNPFKHELKVSFSSHIEGTDAIIKIYNLLGKVIFSTETKTKMGNNTVDLKLSGVNAGTYFCSIEFNGKKKLIRLMKAE